MPDNADSGKSGYFRFPGAELVGVPLVEELPENVDSDKEGGFTTGNCLAIMLCSAVNFSKNISLLGPEGQVLILNSEI